MKVTILFFLFSALLSNAVWAGFSSGKVISITVSDASVAVLFSVSSEITDSPRCNEKKLFSLNLSKPSGLAAYTALLEAKKEGYDITVTGLNTCANEWKAEDVKNIELH